MNEKLHIVLFEPEIPPNTGNIARLCACTGCNLHLVHPLGFEITDKHLKRAGLDYWQHVSVHEHQDWQSARESIGMQRNWYALSSKAENSLWDVSFQAGLSVEILAQLKSIRIPMRSDAPVRSLNLSNACAVSVFEALRQLQSG